MIVFGARPQFIKSSPIVHEFLKRTDVKLQLIHSGQHYDYQLSQLFFEEMKLPAPLLNLKIGSGSHAVQTGRAMISLERCMRRAGPDIVLVPGDTNTTLAAALAGVKLCLPIAHIEAGARSYDMSMPEEINRRLTDHASSMLFAPTLITAQNLRAEGIPSQRVHLAGDTMVDALLAALPAASKLRNELLSNFDVAEGEYILVTAHRPGNVDEPRRLKSIVETLIEASKQIKIVFPAHPRIMNRLRAFHLLGRLKRCRSLVFIKPIGYLEMIAMLGAARAVLTDSGGLQKEAFLLGVPCATMRNRTEWTETVKAGANVLVDVDRTKILEMILKAMKNHGPKSKPIYSDNPFGDGKAAGRIADTIIRAYRTHEL
jgi:UDP-N-acetylglucosamine 2-epimerase (non-hydrolysing)